MVGAALDHDVARIDRGFALIHDQHQLAFDDDAVVDGFGAVHQRVARAFLCGV